MKKNYILFVKSTKRDTVSSSVPGLRARGASSTFLAFLWGCFCGSWVSLGTPWGAPGSPWGAIGVSPGPAECSPGSLHIPSRSWSIFGHLNVLHANAAHGGQAAATVPLITTHHPRTTAPLTTVSVTTIVPVIVLAGCISQNLGVFLCRLASSGQRADSFVQPVENLIV